MTLRRLLSLIRGHRRHIPARPASGSAVAVTLQLNASRRHLSCACYDLRSPSGDRTVRQLEERSKTWVVISMLTLPGSKPPTMPKVMDKDVPKALEILSDILQNSSFDESRISRGA
ncbi:hypothetical protein HPP92_012970 [Vanilla planifolia]|uniref:Uncharacterized protein n=1 Tax=Vanilla planifolia TaxID=51239 RepID=A0A835QRI2_VANPL|nr:hypothetical protein HPP92_012970 [Vanilla planifolia]